MVMIVYRSGHVAVYRLDRPGVGPLGVADSVEDEVCDHCDTRG